MFVKKFKQYHQKKGSIMGNGYFLFPILDPIFKSSTFASKWQFVCT